MKTIKADTLLKIFLALFLTLLIVLSGISLLTNNQTLNVNTLIYKVDNLEHANQLEDDYDLKLTQISPSGLAFFQTSNISQIDTLLDMGFAYDSINQLAKPPWQSTDEDPYLNQQYALEMMNTTEAWTITQGSSEVMVAIIDTGIDITHDEFIGKISTLSYNSSTLSVGINEVIDDYGHGTMVAGIIGAIKDNRTGIAGITSNVQLMIIKANANGEDTFKDSALIEGIYYAADHGADIINLSLGSTYANPQTQIALDYAKSKGLLIVAASGNDGVNEPFYPAAFPSTISVSAVDESTLIAEYSNYGDTIDISAPGTDIITTAMNNGYASVSGTSFAAPQITGVLALMMSYFPDMNPLEIMQRLLQSANDYGNLGKDIYYGYGIANTYNALTFDFSYVTFETFEGTLIEPALVKIDDKLVKPEDPLLKDHIFEGWYKDSDFQIPWDFENDLVNQDLTLYAKYNAEYHQVSFISEGTQIESLIVKHGDTFPLPESYLDNHRFVGWTYDIENTNPYIIEPLLRDIILYAHFEEIIYYDINLYIDDYFYDQISIEANTIYNPNLLNKEGYIFSDWYIDETQTIAYDKNNPITENLNLYSSFEPEERTINLMIDQQLYQSMTISYNDTPILPTPEIENSHFVGWYQDPDFQIKYSSQPIKDNLILYGYYLNEAYKVTYHIDDEFIEEWVPVDQEFIPYTPSKYGYIFIGWYLDSNLNESYQDSYLNDQIDLYPKFEIKYYQIDYYKDDDQIYQSYQIQEGQFLEVPMGPEKTSSQFFDYSFLQWSIDLENIEITQTYAIYPQYEKNYIPNSISINPGIDTIEKNAVWIDSGISEIGDTMTVNILGDVDTSIPGKYKLTYEVKEETKIIVSLTRMIKVTEYFEKVTINLNPGINTIYLGDTYIESGASSNLGEVLISSDINSNQAGIYKVTYKVIYQGMVYEKIRYVHVIENANSSTNLYYVKKEDDDYEIA